MKVWVWKACRKKAIAGGGVPGCVRGTTGIAKRLGAKKKATRRLGRAEKRGRGSLCRNGRKEEPKERNGEKRQKRFFRQPEKGVEA